MASTVAERIEFNHLTEDDFTDAQVVRMKREIRQLAAALVTLPAAAAPIGEDARALLCAQLAPHLAAGIEWASIAPDFAATLRGYAQAALKVYGEGGGE